MLYELHPLSLCNYTLVHIYLDSFLRSTYSVTLTENTAYFKIVNNRCHGLPLLYSPPLGGGGGGGLFSEVLGDGDKSGEELFSEVLEQLSSFPLLVRH